jgi:KDO2-lipid IV(A) lauroyltransferase
MTPLLYYLLFGFTWLVSLIPFWLMYRISDLLYMITYYLVRYRKETVFGNLRKSFPEKSDHEIKLLAKAYYRHFCDFMLESLKCIRIPAGELNKRMKLTNPEVLQELGIEGKNFALVSAHYGNWEWLNYLPLKMKHDLLIIFRPLKNKSVDRLSYYMRTRFNAFLYPMESVYRHGLEYMAEKKLFSIWFLADQRPPRISKFWTRFLNQEAPFFEGTEKISRKLGLAVVFLDVQKVRRGYYEVTLKKLFDNAAHTGENVVMLACVKEMEHEIIQNPALWLWSHKRFKHSRPENIKLVAS